METIGQLIVKKLRGEIVCSGEGCSDEQQEECGRKDLICFRMIEEILDEKT